MKKFEINEAVWITQCGRSYHGRVVKVFEDPSAGLAVSVATDENGIRTVLAEDCSYDKPKRKRKSLSAALKEN